MDVLVVLRIVFGAFLAIAAAALAVPVLVLADLAGGGTGWGLCPDGLGTCSTSYFAGPELFLALFATLLVAIGGAALAARGIRRRRPRQ